MGYLALYRKYRPSLLDDMVGQEEIRKILISSIENDTVSHAYLFSGPRGTGKTTTAKIIAKMVNCEHLVDGNPCNECASCLAINNGSDVIEIDAASNNGVDEIRDLREKANLVPNVCKYKVYIIDEVHMLTTQAFNALLKTLEEPPKHVIFILATTEYYKIPLTIASRCQKFQFKKIDDDDIVLRLKKISELENISVDEDALYEIAKLSDGGMRDAINFLDQLRSYTSNNISINEVYDVCGNISVIEISQLLKNIKENNASYVVQFLENLNNCGKNYNKFLEDVVSFLNDVILYLKGVSSKNFKYDSKILGDVSKIYNENDIFKLIRAMDELITKIRYTSRQSVLIIANFLLVMHEINGIDSEIISKKDDNIDVSSKFIDIGTFKNDVSIKKSENLHVKDDNNLKSESNFMLSNKNIIINNCFSLADKKLKIALTEKWKNIGEYLSNSSYSVCAGKLVDTNIEVIGGDFIIFTAKYNSIIENIYSSVGEYKKLIDLILDGNYNFAIVTLEEWNSLKNEYVKNVKSGIKYNLKSLIYVNDSKNESVNASNNTVVDQLFDIFGKDNVEIK